MIKAIDTYYNGYYFRSRLEARWAIYFDLIGLKYEYELNGICVDGVPYLPDFFIPDHNTFIEIKPIGALVYDYDDKPLQSGRENSRKYNSALEYLTKSGYKYVLLCGSPIEVLKCKDGAFWFVGADDDNLDNPVLHEIDTFLHEFEAEAASLTRFEHGESPFNMAKRHVDALRVRQQEVQTALAPLEKIFEERRSKYNT